MMTFLTKSHKTLIPLFLQSQHFPLLFPCFSTCSQGAQTASTAASAAAFSGVLIHIYNFSPQVAKHVSSALIHSVTPKKLDSRLSYLKIKGFSDTQLERFVSAWPEFLNANRKRYSEPKLNIFQDFGLSASEIVEMLSTNPKLLKIRPDNLTAYLSLFKDLLGMQGYDPKLAELLSRVRCLARSNLEETVLPNIEFLKSCGVPMEQITTQMCLRPSFFRIKPENLVKCVHKVDQLGVERSNKTFMYVLQAVSSISDESFELKLKTLRDLGFPKKNTWCRSLFAQSEQKIKAVTELLLKTGKYDMSCIVRHPWRLGHSLEKRYKPRIEVLKILENRKRINKWPPLTTLTKMSNKKFYQEYVCPYMNDVGETIIAKNPELQK